ncbi:hypothetical protein GCM10027422_27480 [Hymenobacter arcticus]
MPDLLLNPALHDPAANPGPDADWHVVPDDYPLLNPWLLTDCCGLLPLADGAWVAYWPHLLGVYEADGQFRAQYPAGTAVAASPDGQQLLACDPDSFELLVLKTSTLEELEAFGLPAPAAANPLRLWWLPGNRLLVLTAGELGVLTPGRQWQWRWPAPGSTAHTADSAAWLPTHPGQVLVADRARGRLVALDLATGRERASRAASSPTLPNPAAPLLVLDNLHLTLVDPLTLVAQWHLTLGGTPGVRFASEHARAQGGAQWPLRGWPSPDGRWLLAADVSAQLWLLDPTGQVPPRAIRRAVVDMAFAAGWRTPHRVLVLGNQGRAHLLDLTQPAPVWQADTLRPAEAADYQLDPPAPVPAPAALAAALHALATTRSPAAFAAARAAVAAARAATDWPGLLPGPALLAAGLRHYLWYRPESGFDLAPFGELRRQLAQAQPHLPGAPVAVALAAHDQLFTAFVGPPVDYPSQYMYRVADALGAVQDYLLDHPATPDAATGRPFGAGPQGASLHAATEAAQQCLYCFMGAAEDYALLPLLAAATTRFPADFQQLVLALTPGEQLRLLDVLDFSGVPALLRVLAALPDEAVQRQAQELLQAMADENIDS